MGWVEKILIDAKILPPDLGIIPFAAHPWLLMPQLIPTHTCRIQGSDWLEGSTCTLIARPQMLILIPAAHQNSPVILLGCMVFLISLHQGEWSKTSDAKGNDQKLVMLRGMIKANHAKGHVKMPRWRTESRALPMSWSKRDSMKWHLSLADFHL